MMKVLLAVGMVVAVSTLVDAQGPDDRPRGPGGPPRGMRTPPDFHLMTALDADKDGKISAKEIANAVAALKKLDKDKDGKLSSEEIGWPPSLVGGGFPGFGGPGFGGPGFGRGGPPGFEGRGEPGMRGFPGFGGGGGGFPGFGSQAGRRPQRPDPDSEAVRGSADRTSGGGPRRKFFTANQLQQLDQNDDGKITKDEIPERMQKVILGRVDTNEDGTIDKAELAVLAESEGKKD